MEESADQFPHKMFEAIRALADGNLVAVHGKVQLNPDMPWIALIHIFRFEGDLIIEEWEAAQEVPKESPNENGVVYKKAEKNSWAKNISSCIPLRSFLRLLIFVVPKSR